MTFQRLGISLGNTTHDRSFLLLAVTNHNNFFQLGIISERHFEQALLTDLDFLGGHTNVGNDKNA